MNKNKLVIKFGNYNKKIYDKTTIKNIVHKYREGYTIKEVAKIFCISLNQIENILKDNKIKKRSPYCQSYIKNRTKRHTAKLEKIAFKIIKDYLSNKIYEEETS